MNSFECSKCHSKSLYISTAECDICGDHITVQCTDCHSEEEY